MLRIYDGQGEGSNIGVSLTSHHSIVEQVTRVLNPIPSSEDPNQSMSDSDRKDSKMPKYEELEKPDDLMMLDQYHTGLRKETLARSVPQSLAVSHKKKRLDKGVSDSQ